MALLGLNHIFQDDRTPFRGIASHLFGRDDESNNPSRPAISCVIYGIDAIRNYLIMHCENHRSKQHFQHTMCTNLNMTASIHADNKSNEEYIQSAYERLCAPTFPRVIDDNIDKYGSKISKLIEYLNDNRVDNVIPKTIIFSMYDDLLHITSRALSDSDIKFVTFKNDSSTTRATSLASFSNDMDVRVLLLSTKTSSSGLNLQTASNLIFLDPCGSSPSEGAAIEQQCIGRIIRLGQTKNVKIVRLVTRGTVEQFYYDNVKEYRQSKQKRYK